MNRHATPIPLPELWAAMLATYGHRWASAYGQNPDGVAAATWATGLADLTARQVAAGLRNCLTFGDGWPPTLPEFRGLCLGIPSLAAVQRELRATDTSRGPFARMVWDQLDAWAYRHADARAAERMLRDAYEAARERVMAGEKLPEPAAAELAHDTTAKPKPAIPETREERIARLQALLGEEFNPAVTDPTFDPHEAHKPRVPSVDELREAAA